MVDATSLSTGYLYMGSAPAAGTIGWDVIVLCARSYQPPASEFPSVHVIHAPFRDTYEPLTTEEWDNIGLAVDQTVQNLRSGRIVLVTCQEGRNRSGLVTGFALKTLLGWTGPEAVEHIKQRRPWSLTNNRFVELLR